MKMYAGNNADLFWNFKGALIDTFISWLKT